MSETFKAQLKYLHIPPRKTRLVADLVRGLSVNAAQAHLFTNPRRPSEHILKLLKSAIANAKQKNIDPAVLYIKDIRVDQGPMLKRYTPRAQGGASPIQKKMSHVTVILGIKETPHVSRFTIPEKPKKTKEVKKSKESEKKTEEKKDETKVKVKKGFMQKVFRRKAI